MAKKGGKKVKSNFDFDFSGVDKLIKDAQTACDKDLLKLLASAYESATKSTRQEMHDWFAVTHRRDHDGKHVADAWMDGKASYGKTTLTYVFGYDSRQTLVPIYLEYGTPRIQPEFVMQHLANENEPKAIRAFEKALEDELRSKGLIE